MELKYFIGLAHLAQVAKKDLQVLSAKAEDGLSWPHCSAPNAAQMCQSA